MGYCPLVLGVGDGVLSVGDGARQQVGPDERVKLFRVLLLRHHAAVVKHFERRARIQAAAAETALVQRRRRVLFAPNQNGALRQS